jgi:hypothetical protein
LSSGWRNLLKRKETFWLMGFSTCLSLLVEEKVSCRSRLQLWQLIMQKRRAELGKLRPPLAGGNC